nr:protein FAR1-related sequence 5-like [Tanacetum cinerariifolium]
MILIVEDESSLVPHSESNVLQVDDIVMDVVQDDSNDNPVANDVDVYDIDPEFVPTPMGHKYGVPNVPVDQKPKKFTVFNNYDDAYNMYKEYAAKARFGVYVNLDCKEDENEDGKRKRKRKSSSTLTDCKAKIGLKAILGTNSYKLIDFVENHNHPLIDPSIMDLSHARRQLEFGEYMFIHLLSLSNIGPQKAHMLRVALLGGFDKVRGMPSDWNNFGHGLNIFIGDRDAQMLVDKMLKRMEHVPEFLFYHHTIKDELCHMFWVDETMKCNYVAFGDIVSFDATFDTNKYDMVFMPFTGIDHHQKCVTFRAALLSDETTASYSWMLECFLKVHKKQPTLAITDQDGALRKAILKVFTESHHRLCMEKQRYTQRVLDNSTVEKTHVMLTQLPIERHVCEVYTHSIFKDVQDEICKGLYACSQIDFRTDGDIDRCRILQRDKRSNTVVEATVKDLKQELEIDAASQNMPQNKNVLYKDLLGVKAPPRVSSKNPKRCPNKGHRRFKGAAEKGKAKKKARINRKVPFRQRECANRLAHEDANKRAAEEVNESDEDEEVNESEKDNDVDEYDFVEGDDELDKDDANDDYDKDEDNA